MRVLGIDTATTGCSAAVWQDGAVLAQRAARMPRGQSEALMPMVEAVVAEAGGGYAALDLFAVTVGPGAFTGLRIGLAAARGMALAAGRPCLGVGTLEAIAAGVPPAARRASDLLVVVDAKRADVYAQTFDADGVPRGASCAVLPGDLAALCGDGPVDLAGDAAARVADDLRGAGVAVRVIDTAAVPDAAVVAALAAARWDPAADPAPPEPVYLRPPDVTLPTGKRRRRAADSGR